MAIPNTDEISALLQLYNEALVFYLVDLNHSTQTTRLMPRLSGAPLPSSKMDGTNYFVCTLAQAARVSHVKGYRTIPEFLDHQAERNSDLPAVGFYEIQDTTTRQLTPHVHNFTTVRQTVCDVAKALQELSNVEERQTVALLCPSSAVFLYSWLALIYLGHSVLLIAPQCSPSAISHLCKTTDCSVLLYDQSYEALAKEVCSETKQQDSSSLRIQRLPFRSDCELFSVVDVVNEKPVSRAACSETDVAYLHHTSGTSTGLPKPIPQTHLGGLGVLPQLDGKQEATFTTTPLYHGGVADLFRAWTSNALIWLFPGKDLPITAANVCQCLDVAKECSDKRTYPNVRYFSSVPYVLQMMMEHPNGMVHLRDMSIVGVGGAALPAEVGDDLVHKGVNLISRFGSAECGFLLSSYRDFKSDTEWQHHRLEDFEDTLTFEQRDDGLHELIVKPDWPHMAKINREDGGFATSDLFEAHTLIKNAWRYHSRADSQLTLITGKKFDPAPLEAALAASTTSLSDVLIFGNGRQYPGALIFRSSESASLTDAELIAQITPQMEKLNKDNQSHARILAKMLVAMPCDPGALEKSSKGTVIRGKTEQKFSETISGAYETETRHKDVADSEVPETVLDLVNSVLFPTADGKEKAKPDSDLFAGGLDSIGSMRIRHGLSGLLPKTSSKLPLSVVEDTGTVSRLSNLILAMRHGKQPSEGQDPKEQMIDLVKLYDKFQPLERVRSGLEDQVSAAGINILMTGPTGSLGSHALHQLLHNPAVQHIYLLVRGATVQSAKERVLKAFAIRELRVPPSFDSRVKVLTCKLSSPGLGLSLSQYQELTERVDVIAHLAWAVNFLLPLRAFTSHLDGLLNLLKFALHCSRGQPPRFLFCSTVASVSQAPKPIPEAILFDPAVAGPTGYGRSKWVAERVCEYAHKSSSLRGRISVVRVGQLSGASDTGVWAESEAYPLILSTYQALSCLPDLDAARSKQSHDRKSYETLSWLPVDTAAKAFVDLMIPREQAHQQRSAEPRDTQVDVFHLLPPPGVSTRSWSDFINVISSNESTEIKKVPVEEWLDKLEGLRDIEETKAHPALRLVPFWREVYCKPGGNQPEDKALVNGKRPSQNGQMRLVSNGFQMIRTLEQSPSLWDAQGLSDEYIIRLWRWTKKGSST